MVTPSERTAPRFKRSAVVPGVVLLAAAAVAAGSGRLAAVGIGRGDPDPGGHRFAAIRGAAAGLTPPDASHVVVSVDKSRWGTGGCDGGPAGWTRPTVDVTFDGPDAVPADVEARLSAARWHMVPQDDDPASGPPSVQPPAGQYRYEPIGPNPYEEFAILSPQVPGGAGHWDLWVTAEPAGEVDHDC